MPRTASQSKPYTVSQLTGYRTTPLEALETENRIAAHCPSQFDLHAHDGHGDTERFTAHVPTPTVIEYLTGRADDSGVTDNPHFPEVESGAHGSDFETYQEGPAFFRGLSYAFAFMMLAVIAICAVVAVKGAVGQ